MIDKVIICGVRRANQLVPTREIKQSIGRAGRSYVRNGEAYILVNDCDVEYANSCIKDIVPPIKSELTNEIDVAFHILPWFDQIKNEDDFNKWFSKSLAFVQGKNTSYQKVVEYLSSTGCIKDNKITAFGNISVKKYFSPDRLVLIRQKMIEANMERCADQIPVLSWMFAYKHLKMADVDTSALFTYKNMLRDYGMYFTRGELLHGYVYHCILSNKRPAWLKHAISVEMEDIQRLFSAAVLIAEIEDISIQDKLNEALICAIRKVPPEIAVIIDRFGLSKKASAYELGDMDISSPKDLCGMEDYILSYGTESLKNELIEKGFLQQAVVSRAHRLNKGMLTQ